MKFVSHLLVETLCWIIIIMQWFGPKIVIVYWTWMNLFLCNWPSNCLPQLRVFSVSAHISLLDTTSAAKQPSDILFVHMFVSVVKRKAFLSGHQCNTNTIWFDLTQSAPEVFGQWQSLIISPVLFWKITQSRCHQREDFLLSFKKLLEL